MTHNISCIFPSFLPALIIYIKHICIKSGTCFFKKKLFRASGIYLAPNKIVSFIFYNIMLLLFIWWIVASLLLLDTIFWCMKYK